jgi:hypothetical protein
MDSDWRRLVRKKNHSRLKEDFAENTATIEESKMKER